MANGGNPPIAPIRKLIAAVFGTVAAFVILFGLGMQSWAIVALGAAFLALAIALATVRAGGRTWVVGAGHVHSASEPPTQYAFGRCELQLVIDAPGLPPRSKKIIEPRVPVSKWPALGQTLPIRVALDDPRHIRVLWDEVPTHTEAGFTDLPPEFTDPPPEYAAQGPPDEVLIGQEAPPWAGRAPEDDFHDPVGDPLGAPLGAPRRDDPVGPAEQREPVRLLQRPGGPVVLEGTLVEHPSGQTLPRRATPAPRPPAEETYVAATGQEAPDLDPSAVSPQAGPSAAAPTEAPTEVPSASAAPGASTARAASTEPADPLDPLDLPLDDPESGPTIFDFDSETVDPAAPISGIGITLLVTGLSRSLEFYRDRLGFTEVDQGTGNAVLAFGATRLVLREVTGAQPVNRRLVHVNLDVDDIQGAYERLRDSGVRFTYPPRVVNRGTKLEVWAAAFRDPDGHGIALTQWRERAEA